MPLSVRDQLVYHNPGAAGRFDPPVGGVPVERETAPNGVPSRTYYDAETNRTYTLAVSQGESKRYLALTPAEWQAIAPQLREMHNSHEGAAPSRSIVDLSIGYHTSFDDTNGLKSVKIKPDSREFQALISIRQHLVDTGKVEAIADESTAAHENNANRRASFAARSGSGDYSEEALNTLSVRANEYFHRNGLDREPHDPRLATLVEHLNQETEQLREEMREKQGRLIHEGRQDPRAAAQLNSEINTIREKIAALLHQDEILSASTLLRSTPNAENTTDWRLPLLDAYNAKQILVDHFVALKEGDPSSHERRVIEEKATDIASLLIPTKLGNPDEAQESEHILQLFYAGGSRLPDFLADEEGNVAEMPPVSLPKSQGHRYLREVLAAFHSAQVRPDPAIAAVADGVEAVFSDDSDSEAGD